jgi:shikimate 5-dehydrogenase
MKKYLVIGNPIDHSLSPLLHNFWIRKHGIDAIYEKKLLKQNDIETIISEMRKKKIQGINVTVPFKKDVIPFLDKLSETAKRTQSVNTIFEEQDKLVGDNTDVFGFSEAIKSTNFNLKNKKALILGAGGVVPSLVLALKNLGILEIILSNRTKAKAEDLKKNFPFLKVINWGEKIKSDLIINATSIGIKQNEEIKFDYSNLNGQLFYDVIYNPSETKFLENAKKSGKKIENGKNMFIYQAMKAFEIWHGVRPEINQEISELIK